MNQKSVQKFVKREKNFKQNLKPSIVKGKNIADGSGLRYNTGKNKLELIPSEWEWALGMILTRGAIKYDVRNWEKGMSHSYVLGSGRRHLVKYLAGERYDPETGCHHLAMVAWNMLALMTYDIRGIGEDDLKDVGNLEWLEKTAVDPGPALQKLMEEKNLQPK